MSNTQERIQKRREYLKRKGRAYTKASLATFFTMPCVFMGLVFMLAAINLFTAFRGIERTDMQAGVLCIVLCLLFWVASFRLGYLARQAHRTAKQLPYVPPVTADTLPAEEVLVRGSEQPSQEQGKVLLRGTGGSVGTGEQELLRSSQGQRTD